MGNNMRVRTGLGGGAHVTEARGSSQLSWQSSRVASGESRPLLSRAEMFSTATTGGVRQRVSEWRPCSVQDGN